MTSLPDTTAITALLEKSSHVVVAMADNPDGDSVASALALEEILSDMGKQVTMFCGVGLMPNHFGHLPGWDRVTNDLPHTFDLTVIVDCSTLNLFEVLARKNQLGWLRAKPCLVLDHHDVPDEIDFATVRYNDPTSVATGQVIYELAAILDWKLSPTAMDMIAVSILSDSLGLMSSGTSARSIRIIAELVEQGVRLYELDDARRSLMKRSIDLMRYKGQLLQRIEFYDENRIATVTIPWDEIEKFSHAYNPSMLVMDEMRLVEDVAIAIAFKIYRDGKITAKIRCNPGTLIAGKLAEAFGGGGHPYASGFKITDKRDIGTVKAACIAKTIELLQQS